MMKIALLIIALLVLTGCGKQELTNVVDIPAEENKVITVTDDEDIIVVLPEATESDAEGGVFMIHTEDGVTLVAERHIADVDKIGTVLLLHMLGRSRGDWDATVDRLTGLGFDVVTMDLRGMGDSTGDYTRFKEEDYAMMESDIALVASGIEGPLSVMGASIGANLAILYAAEHPVQKLVLLSPGENYRGVKTYGPAGTITVPTLIISSEEDSYAALSSEELYSIIDNAELDVREGLGHGTSMFEADSAVLDRAIGFLAP